MNEQKKLELVLVQQENKTKKQQGITLIALIVTIIIMLILAGVTINVAIGDNGLFSKSKEAIERHKEEAAREKVSMAIGEYLLDINTREMTEEEKDNHLKEILEKVGPTKETEDGKYYETEVDGYIFWIDRNSQEIISKGKTDGTEEKPEPEKEIESIALSQTTLAIGVGKTTEEGIKVTYTPSNAKNQGVTWSTSDETKVTVDSNGKVTGVAETGENETVTITATTANGKTATCTVLVGGVEKNININGTSTVVNTKDIYGATVLGYTCARSDVSWKLFYIDEVNKDNTLDVSKVYLIASDYVVPPVKNKTPQLLKSVSTKYPYPKAYRFGTDTNDTSILGSFKGTVPNTTFTQKFLTDWKGISATSQKNLQATNYMLDQTIWSEYKGSKSTEAYGGPTLPLFAASYNDICKESTKLGYIKAETGYKVSIGEGNYAEYQYNYEKECNEKIYFYGNQTDSAYGTWIASPSASDATYMMTAGFDGTVYPNECIHPFFGFRPIVSLNSNVQFIDNGNGTYTIKP